MKVKEVTCRVADNGNAIIDGVNYGGIVVAVNAVKDIKTGRIFASCVNRTGRTWILSKNGKWKRTYDRHGRPTEGCTKYKRRK